jgi:hypothetical protein
VRRYGGVATRELLLRREAAAALLAQLDTGGRGGGTDEAGGGDGDDDGHHPSLAPPPALLEEAALGALCALVGEGDAPMVSALAGHDGAHRTAALVRSSQPFLHPAMHGQPPTPCRRLAALHCAAAGAQSPPI